MKYILTPLLVAIIVACALPPSSLETTAHRLAIESIMEQSDCQHRGGQKVKGKCFLPPSAAASAASATGTQAKKKE